MIFNMLDGHTVRAPPAAGRAVRPPARIPRARHRRRRRMTTDTISPDLKTALKRLKLSPVLDTLPERLALARPQKMAPHDPLLPPPPRGHNRPDGRAPRPPAPPRPPHP